MFKYALGQLKSNKLIKTMATLVLSVLVIIFSISLFLNDAVFNFIAPRFYNPRAKVDVKVSAAGGDNFIFEKRLDAYRQHIDKITPTMNLFALCNIGEKSQFAAISGVHSNNLFFDEDYELVDGTLFYQANECVIPYTFAENMAVRVGEYIKLECNKKVVSVKVVGIFKGYKVQDALETIYLSDKTTSYFLLDAYADGLHNTLNIQLNGSISAQDFVKLLQSDEQSNNINCVVSKDINMLNSALSLSTVPTTACIIMLMLLVVIVVFALYYLDSIKQHKLIATFRDLGASKRQIYTVFLGAHFVIGIVGGIIGAVLSVLAAFAISAVAGIKINCYAVAAIGFALLIISNFLISLVSTAISIKSRKRRVNTSPKIKTNIIYLMIILFTTAAFATINMFLGRFVGMGGVKNYIAVAAFIFLMVSVYAIISISYDVYYLVYNKIFARTTNLSIWLAKASSLKSKQVRNFFVILTVIIMTIVTTGGLLYSVQNETQSIFLAHNDSVIFCANINKSNRAKVVEAFSAYDTKIYWSGKQAAYFKDEEKTSSQINIMDLSTIDEMTILPKVLTDEQREYFAGDKIGMYYSISRSEMLKEKIGTVATIVTNNGDKQLPYLGKIEENAYTMSDVIINKATAEYLGIDYNIAYIRLQSGDIDMTLADTKSTLFNYGVVAEKQSEIAFKIAIKNKPMGDLFNIANNILGVLLLMTLAFYVVLISNYQTDNFAKLKSMGMSNRGLFVSQTSLILPLIIYAALIGLGLAQFVKASYNVLFISLAVGAVRYTSKFVFFALPFIAAAVASIVYLVSHYLVIKRKQSPRIDLER